MTRPRSRAPGSDSVYRRSRLAILVLLALIGAACIGGGTPAAPAVQSTAPPPVSSTAPSTQPSASIAASAAPTASPEPTETSTAEPTPNASLAAGSVDACTGTDENRAFLAKAAEAFDWPVYCAALPARWFLAGGSYSGGKLDISYKGPNGALLELHEGAFCTDGTGCVPEGSDAGNTIFGDQSATLVHFEDGRVAAVVDRGEPLSWLAIAEGLSDDAFRSITAELIRLD